MNQVGRDGLIELAARVLRMVEESKERLRRALGPATAGNDEKGGSIPCAA